MRAADEAPFRVLLCPCGNEAQTDCQVTVQPGLKSHLSLIINLLLTSDILELGMNRNTCTQYRVTYHRWILGYSRRDFTPVCCSDWR